MELVKYTQSLGSQQLADDFLKKKIHLICVAVNSLTNFNAFATMEGGISEFEAHTLAEKVSRLNETGTLHPRLSMTIIPLTITKGRDDSNNRDLIKKHILDCFEVNEVYVKCPDMLFALEDRGDFAYQLAMEVLKEILDSTAGFTYTKTVFYLPYI